MKDTKPRRLEGSAISKDYFRIYSASVFKFGFEIKGCVKSCLIFPRWKFGNFENSH